ncbi:MAB_1171c family putative transporter [Streptomyces sp. NPDC005355]|uniref:MAB_1171c family putative transporter n=1 Tax=Streptomyces sp. NPDC005355 TaxID=3157038 RepID=UPI0033A143F4
MLAELTGFSGLIEDTGTGAIWGAVLLRIPATCRDRRQRGLCIAVAAAAAAMTLRLAPVNEAVDLVTRDPHMTQLAMHLSGAFSAVVVLDFLLVVTGGGPPRGRLHLIGAALLLSLVVLDATAPAHTRDTVAPHGAPLPSLEFWLTLLGMHLAADSACVIVCWRYSRRSKGPSRMSLALFGLGTAFAGLFWVGYLFYIPERSPWAPALLSLAMGLHGLLRAASIAVPTLLDARRAVDGVRTLHRLWPLWRDLVEVVPSVALYKPRNHLREVLWPRGPRDLIIYRRLVEIRDAILVLREYVPANRAAAHEPGSPDSFRGEAHALARMLREARRAKLAGEPPHADPARLVHSGGTDITAETEFLVRVATAYRCPTAPYRPRKPVATQPQSR